MTQSSNLSFSYENPLKQRFSQDFFKNIPQTPGVYFMLDWKGDILYIGKAKNLRNRVSSYSRVKPGKCSDLTLELVENIQSIRWTQSRSEKEALAREMELLHAVRPPFNIAHTEAEHYLFIGLKSQTQYSTNDQRIKCGFQLSSRASISKDGYRVYGCFKYRRKVKSGYTALLRLLFAASFNRQRFAYPARLTRVSPPWLYSLEIPAKWVQTLDEFLSGKSCELLPSLVANLLENEQIPPFMRPSIQEDIEIAREFFRFGPKFTYVKARKAGLEVISHADMDQLILAG